MSGRGRGGRELEQAVKAAAEAHARSTRSPSPKRRKSRSRSRSRSPVHPRYKTEFPAPEIKTDAQKEALSKLFAHIEHSVGHDEDFDWCDVVTVFRRLHQDFRGHCTICLECIPWQAGHQKELCLPCSKLVKLCGDLAPPEKDHIKVGILVRNAARPGELRRAKRMYDAAAVQVFGGLAKEPNDGVGEHHGKVHCSTFYQPIQETYQDMPHLDYGMERVFRDTFYGPTSIFVNHADFNDIYFDSNTRTLYFALVVKDDD